MVKVSLIWMHDEGIFGLFLFDLWYLFGVDFVIGKVVGEVGIMFFSCLGMDCNFVCLLVIGLVSQYCVKLFLFLVLWRGR
jgi:hypothetical protein